MSGSAGVSVPLIVCVITNFLFSSNVVTELQECLSVKFQLNMYSVWHFSAKIEAKVEAETNTMS